MLKELGPQSWVWEEMKNVNAMLFRFKDKERPQSFVSNLSSMMHVRLLLCSNKQRCSCFDELLIPQSYPLEDVLSAGYILTEYNPELITEILSDLDPEKVRVTVVSREFESKTKLVEEWYGVKYNLEKIDQGLIKVWINLYSFGIRLA